MTNCPNPIFLLINEVESPRCSPISITKPDDAQRMKLLRQRTLCMFSMYRFSAQTPIDDIICSSMKYIP